MYITVFLKHREFTNHIYPWFPFQKLDAEPENPGHTKILYYNDSRNTVFWKVGHCGARGWQYLWEARKPRAVREHQGSCQPVAWPASQGSWPPANTHQHAVMDLPELQDAKYDPITHSFDDLSLSFSMYVSAF